MNQHFELLFYYINSVRRFPWTALATAALVMLLGWAVVITMPDSYRAQSTLHVPDESISEPLLKGLAAEGVDPRSTAVVIQHTLLNRQNLLSILQHDDLGFTIKNDKSREAIVRHLMKEVWVSGDPKTNIYTITYFDGSPDRARRVVAALTARFVEASSRGSLRDSQAMERFLAQEKERYWKLLTDERRNLEAFRKRYREVLPSSGESYYSELDSWKEALNKARLELDESQRRLQALEAQKRSSGGGRSGGVTINDELARLQRELAAIRLKYTEFHPDAMALAEEINILRQRKRELGGNYLVKPTGRGENRVAGDSAQTLAVAIAKARGDVEALQVRVQSYEDIVNDLESKVSVVPRVESELAVIEQRYESLQKTYDDIVRRYEAALIANQVDRDKSIAKVRVVEAPAASPLPIGPKRLKLIVAVTVLGVLAGVAAAAFRSRQKQVVGTLRELRRQVELPVLGAVSMYRSREALARERADRIKLTLAWSALATIALLLAVIYRHSV